jgi:hypothetical protein
MTRAVMRPTGVLAAAGEARASRTWADLAGRGHTALIDHRDVAEAGLLMLTVPALWGACPHVMVRGARTAIGRTRRARHLSGRPRAEFIQRLTGAGIPAGRAELLMTRDWAILAGENDYGAGTFQQITGRPPRPVAEFFHEYRAEFR